jgi:hypothetical protein
MLVMDISALLGGGVVLFGRCQIRRGKNITMQKLEMEGLTEEPAPAITLLGSDNGAARDLQTPMTVVEQTPDFLRSDARVTATNFDLAIEGNFQLTTLIVEATSHGSR